jgi:hypothetical protein
VARRAAQDEGGDQQHNDGPDEGAQYPAPVEDVGVINAEADREDE